MRGFSDWDNAACEVGSKANISTVDAWVGQDATSALIDFKTTDAYDNAAVKPGSPIDISQGGQDAAVAKATAAGFEIVPSNDSTLLLDLDDKLAETRYASMLPIVQQHLPIIETGRWSSKSGGLHVKLNVGEALPASDRLLLQACLGSDGTREFLSLLRVRNGNQHPSLLFKPTPASATGSLNEA